VTRDPAGPDAADVFAHRGRFLRVLPETERSQTTVMAVAPGADDGPEEQHDGDQIMWSRARRSRASTSASAGRDRGATPLFLLTVYAPPEYEPGTTAADSNLSPVS